MLCLACLQTRLGRRLESEDFLVSEINQRHLGVNGILSGDEKTSLLPPPSTPQKRIFEGCTEMNFLEILG
jgi:hypothetical protein